MNQDMNKDADTKFNQHLYPKKLTFTSDLYGDCVIGEEALTVTIEINSNEFNKSSIRTKLKEIFQQSLECFSE